MGLFDDETRGALVLVGPTGSGKSSLALALRAFFPVELVCMDSMQIYRETRIGTCRPSPEEEALAPHHLFGAYSLRESMTSYRFAREVRPVLTSIRARGGLPVLVGGTGLFLRALFEDRAGAPKTPPALRERLNRTLEKRGGAWLYRALQRLDPAAAALVHRNNTRRVQRYLEVRLVSGTSITDIWARDSQRESPAPAAIGLAVPRALLHARIEARLDAMLAAGWVEETRALRDRGLATALLARGPIGYSPILDYLNGDLDWPSMREKILVDTRRYAKRQMTWFRKVPYIRWFPFDIKSGYNMESIIDFVKRKLP